MNLSKRIAGVSSSATLGMTAKANEMRKQGIEVISFAAGEPDFDTPEHIKKAAKKALDEGFTKYTPASGIPELKEAVATKLKVENGLYYSPSQIIISCGAKHALYNTIQVLCDEDDEVIIPSPYWVTYPEQIKLAGAKPVIVETKEEDGFKLKPTLLAKSITQETKAVILNTPNNPTGAVYSKKDLEAIARVVREAKIYCISDEIYEKIIYGDNHCISIASLNPAMKDLTIVINGVSKTYSMTGWRIGYAAGPIDIIGAMSRLQSHTTSNPTSIAQRAALEAIRGPQEFISQMVSEFERRKSYMLERLNKMKGIRCFDPQGAFYAFPNISELLGRTFNGRMIDSSNQLAELLLEEAKVAVVSGSDFGANTYLRLSYATSMDNITKGLDRIEEVINKIR